MNADTPKPPLHFRSLPPPALWALSLVVGVVAGLGAVGFRALIAIFHNLLFLGEFSASYNANAHTPAAPWGAGIILIPVAGAAGVAFLVKNFAPEAKGHGVPEVIDAVYHNKGIIRPVVSVVKALASALSIGSGGSIGREGPIIQIGASFGSSVGQWLRMSTWQRITLIGCGAGGGIAATFNTPVGGILFAVEIVLQEFSVRTLVPVAISTATATYVGRLFFGANPSFTIPALESPYFSLTRPVALLAYLGLGAIAGLISALFIWSIYSTEGFFEKHVKGGYYVQHMTGMLIVGLLIYGFFANYGHYYVEGVGYATIQDVLSSVPYPVYLLLVLFSAKLLVTSLTLGSGASGGVFSPALFLGATSGAVWGIALNHVFPHLNISPEAFAVAGMAGVVGGSTSAALAAIVMIFEMTLDYTVVLPMTLTVAMSYGVRRILIKDSIYTRKLTLRGEYVPETLRADVHYIRRAKDIMNPIDPETAADFRNRHDFVLVPPEAPLAAVISQMRSKGVLIALVSKDGRTSQAVGVITHKEMLNKEAEDMDLFGF